MLQMMGQDGVMESNKRLSQNSGQGNTTQMMNQSSYMAAINEAKSDLMREWMEAESLVSHSSINQISYLLLIKRKEVKIHQVYQTGELIQKRKEMISFRKEILDHFEANQTIEKRI